MKELLGSDGWMRVMAYRVISYRPSAHGLSLKSEKSETEQKHGFTERFLKVSNIKATARVGVGRLDDSVGQLSDTGTLISVSVIAS